jgi:hypothetical protein
MKKVCILSILILLGQTSWVFSAVPRIREFQTTRLHSTAGAGVGSVLSTEAAILNPASAGFFTDNSFSYQSYSTNLKHESPLRDSNSDQFAGRNNSQGFFLADQTGSLKGGVAYLKQNENNYERSQYIFHSSTSAGPAGTLGFSYRYIKDEYPRNLKSGKFISHQVSLGSLHVLDEKTTIGFILKDPGLSLAGEERLLMGLQYVLSDKITLIADAGAQYTKAFNKKYLWRMAAQLNIFSDFFFRAGQFYDNVTEFKGTGWGVSWIGPNLGVEFSQKISDQIGQGSYLYKDETLVDTSLSAVIKF